MRPKRIDLRLRGTSWEAKREGVEYNGFQWIATAFNERADLESVIRVLEGCNPGFRVYSVER